MIKMVAVAAACVAALGGAATAAPAPKRGTAKIHVTVTGDYALSAPVAGVADSGAFSFAATSARTDYRRYNDSSFVFDWYLIERTVYRSRTLLLPAQMVAVDLGGFRFDMPATLNFAYFETNKRWTDFRPSVYQRDITLTFGNGGASVSATTADPRPPLPTARVFDTATWGGFAQATPATFAWPMGQGAGAAPELRMTVSGIAWVSRVPEPATWATMIIGFGLAGAALRRKAPATA